MSEQEKRPRDPRQAAWLIAVVGLLIAVVLGWAMMAIGSARMRRAGQIQATAEAKNAIALEFAAEQSVSWAQEARLALNKGNWGAAQTRLSRVNDLVTLMEQVAPEGSRQGVSQVRERLAEVQQLVGDQSKDSGAALDLLVTDIDALRPQLGPE